MLCLSCCLIFPLPETILYDLPDSLNDLQSMKRANSSENGDDLSPSSQHDLIIDSNIVPMNHEIRSHMTMTSDLNDLSSPTGAGGGGGAGGQDNSTPKTILRSQQAQVATGGGGKTVTIHSQPEIIQLQPNTPTYNGLSNPCYFAGFNDTLDQYDIEQHIDNRVVISIRGPQHSSSSSSNNNNEDLGKEATKF